MSGAQTESQQGLKKTEVSLQPQRALKNLIRVFYFRKRLSHFRKPELRSCDKKTNIQTVPLSSEANTASFCLYKKRSQMFNLFLNVSSGAVRFFSSSVNSYIMVDRHRTGGPSSMTSSDKLRLAELLRLNSPSLTRYSTVQVLTLILYK